MADFDPVFVFNAGLQKLSIVSPKFLWPKRIASKENNSSNKENTKARPGFTGSEIYDF